MDDRTLIRRIGKGDEHAFRILADRYRRPLYNFFLRSGASIEDSEDLLQQLFMKLIGGSYEIREDASFKTYIYRVAANLLIDHMRRSRRVDFVDFEGLSGDEEIAGPRAARPLPDEEAETSQLRERYAAALETLPAPWRTVLELRVTAEMSYKEIAESTGLTIGAVESILFRARERLSRMLREFGPGGAGR